MLEKIEKEILKKLRSCEMFRGMDIEPFPANFEDYNFTSSLGCLLVRYNGEDISQPELVGSLAQTDTYSYVVYCGLRSLSTLNEAYPIIDEIKHTLTSFKINGKELYPQSIKYAGKINYSDNFWALTFKIKMPFISKNSKNVVEIPAIWSAGNTVISNGG